MMTLASLEQALGGTGYYASTTAPEPALPFSNSVNHFPYGNPLGLSYVDQKGNVTVQNSDRPYEHIREAGTMEQIVNEYLRSAEGHKFIQYAQSRGNNFMELLGVGAADLGENVVAAVMHDGEKGILVGNYEGNDFYSRVQQLARQYGIDSKAALEYTLTHEFGHVAGYDTEARNEAFIKDYFIERAAETGGAERQKYMQLAAVAEYREQEAERTN